MRPNDSTEKQDTGPFLAEQHVNKIKKGRTYILDGSRIRRRPERGAMTHQRPNEIQEVEPTNCPVDLDPGSVRLLELELSETRQRGSLGQLE